MAHPNGSFLCIRSRFNDPIEEMTQRNMRANGFGAGTTGRS
jgi:hypothetical protein